LFMFCWLTIVYCPIAMWTWNPAGWTFVMGGLDFAGGSPVHISSGTAALAIALYLGKRRGYGTERLAYKPHNTFFVVLGTIMLWVGWFGFNGGSALAANVSRPPNMDPSTSFLLCRSLTAHRHPPHASSARSWPAS
jgi:Amt family ammonium transporter